MAPQMRAWAAVRESHLPKPAVWCMQGREATREAVGAGLDASVEQAFQAAQRAAELREAKRREHSEKQKDRRATYQQRVRDQLQLPLQKVAAGELRIVFVHAPGFVDRPHCSAPTRATLEIPGPSRFKQEKRKRDLGMQKSGKNFVEEEKRLARNHGVYSGFDT